MHRRKGHGQCQKRRVQHAQNAGHIAGQQKLYRVANVPVHIPAIGHRLDHSGKIIICQDHGCRILGNLGSHDSHGHTNVRLFQGRGIIHPIPRHGYNPALPLPRFHDADLVLW